MDIKDFAEVLLPHTGHCRSCVEKLVAKTAEDKANEKIKINKAVVIILIIDPLSNKKIFAKSI